MKKKILSLALALAMCLGLTIPAFAESYTYGYSDGIIITACDGVLLILAGQNARPVLHKSDHIVLMEMVREGLHNALKVVSLHAELLVVDHCPHLFFHPRSLLVRPIITAGDCAGL